MAGLIEDDAVTGNCETVALVRRDGSHDRLGRLRFGLAACFAALGVPKNTWLEESESAGPVRIGDQPDGGQRDVGQIDTAHDLTRAIRLAQHRAAATASAFNTEKVGAPS